MENIDCLIWVILSEDLKKKKLVLPKQKIKSIKNGVKKIKNKKRSQWQPRWNKSCTKKEKPVQKRNNDNILCGSAVNGNFIGIV